MKTIKMVALPFTFIAAAVILGGCVGAESIEGDEALDAQVEPESVQPGAANLDVQELVVESTAEALTGTSATTETEPATEDILSLHDAFRQLTASKAGLSSAVLECVGPILIYSQANGRYVTAELGYGGGDYAMLRARATTVGPWEKFDICHEGGVFYFRARETGRWVSAELGYGGGDYGMLRARATSIGPWEQFFFTDHGSFVTITSAANGRLVTAELGYGGGDYAMLRARATTVGAWEKFE